MPATESRNAMSHPSIQREGCVLYRISGFDVLQSFSLKDVVRRQALDSALLAWHELLEWNAAAPSNFVTLPVSNYAGGIV